MKYFKAFIVAVILHALYYTPWFAIEFLTLGAK